jgi:hypothetical protein
MRKNPIATLILSLVAATGGGCLDRSVSTRSAPVGAGPERRFEVGGSVQGRPSIATRGRFVALAWITVDDKHASLFVASSADAGATFGRPVKIDTSGPTPFDPSVAVRTFFDGYDIPPAIVIEWVARSEPFNLTRYASSRDGGKSFTVDPPGKVRLFQTSYDESWTPSPELTGIDPDVGEPQSVLDNDHTLVVAWEDATVGGVRQIAMRRVIQATRGGVQRIALPPVTTEPTAANPAIGRIPGGVLVAWTQDDAGMRSLRTRRVGLDDMCFDRRPGASTLTPTMTYEPFKR